MIIFNLSDDLDVNWKFIVRVITVLVLQHGTIVLDAPDGQPVGQVFLTPESPSIGHVACPVAVVDVIIDGRTTVSAGSHHWAFR